jgi:RNA polymerase sigma-70 factor (ECF subfamily)
VRLSERILHHLPAVLVHDPVAVDERLDAALAEATRRWPQVTIDPDAFAVWVAARVPEGAPSLETALDALRLPDLYLACACAENDPAALAAFDLAFLAPDAQASDDLKQRLRQKLFVAEPGKPPPRIALYAGRGDLARWVRAALARMKIDEARAVREVPTEDALLDAIGLDPEHGPDLAHLKQDARATLQPALREALESLSDRERALLLQYYVDGLGVTELGKLFGLAASNVSRTLARARLQIASQMRRVLLRDHQLGGAELDSLIGLVQSQLSVTGGLRRS